MVLIVLNALGMKIGRAGSLGFRLARGPMAAALGVGGAASNAVGNTMKAASTEPTPRYNP